MSIRKLKIKNFKCFSDWFTVDFENGINILVGNNGTGNLRFWKLLIWF